MGKLKSIKDKNLSEEIFLLEKHILILINKINDIKTHIERESLLKELEELYLELYQLYLQINKYKKAREIKNLLLLIQKRNQELKLANREVVL